MCSVSPDCCHFYISIHLMFLLIKVPWHPFHRLQGHFNTSHVSINLFMRCNQRISCSISIHLMFLLIKYLHWVSTRILIISIHLMFLLILNSWIFIAVFFHFNTSHVSINLLFCIFSSARFCHFNTSHVSINRRRRKWQRRQKEFQYISCFY